MKLFFVFEINLLTNNEYMFHTHGEVNMNLV